MLIFKILILASFKHFILTFTNTSILSSKKFQELCECREPKSNLNGKILNDVDSNNIKFIGSYYQRIKLNSTKEIGLDDYDYYYLHQCNANLINENHFLLSARW